MRVRNLLFCLLTASGAPPGWAESFVAPSSGNLYLQVKGGESAASSAIGLGTSSTTFVPYLTNAPSTPNPSAEVFVKSVSAGEVVHFGIQTIWGGQTYWAFSNAADMASQVAFGDRDNSLRLGGRVIEQTGPNVWLMHLDDAASYLIDDDDDDILIGIRIVPSGSSPLGTVLDFEAPLPTGLVPMSFWQGTVVPAQSRISSQFSRLGIVMRNAALVNFGDGHAASGVNGIAGIDGSGRLDYGSPITLTFVSPSDGATPVTTESFSITTDLWADSQNTVTLTAYGVDGTLLGSTSFRESGTGGVELRLQGIGRFHSVVVRPTLSGTSGGIGFDLVRYGVLTTTGPAQLSIAQRSFQFNYSTGGANPQPQTISVSSAGSAVPFTVTLSGGAWLVTAPLSGTTPSTLSVSVNPSGLAAGVYNGSIRIDAPVSNSPQTISVSLTVRETTVSASPATLSFSHETGTGNPAPQSVSITSTGPSISFRASASGGTWLSVSPSDSSTPRTLAVTVNASGLLPGTYNGSIIIVASAAANAVQYVRVALVVRPRTPRFTAAGIVNAASYAAGLVPGGLATIFGTGLSGISGVEWSDGSRSYKGVSVLVGNIPAPIINLVNQGGQEQISIQAPFELTPGWPTSVTIDNNGNRVTATGVPVFVAQPGIFELPLPRSANRAGAVIHLDGRLVSPDAPADRGEIVSLFLTGAGPLNPPVATGQVGIVPPAITALPVVVGVANIGSAVQFSGYAPGALGLYQINFEVSPDAPTGPSVSLVVKVGEAFSNTVALAVR